MCMFCVLVHHMHADVHASVCICMWMAGCLPQSFVTILKFTYLFVINFFLLRAISHAVVREQLGGLSSCLPFCVSWGSTQVERLANKRLFFTEPYCFGTGSLTELGAHQMTGLVGQCPLGMLLVSASLAAEVLTVTLSCLPGSGSGPHAGVVAALN